MDYSSLIETLTPEMYRRFLEALETGRWPDGSELNSQQRESCMQAVIAWGEANLPEQERVGYIDRRHKAGDNCDDDSPQTLNWKN